MKGTCLGCFGSGRFGACGAATDGPSMSSIDRACDRCGGTGREPLSEILYVLRMNERVTARKRRAA